MKGGCVTEVGCHYRIPHWRSSSSIASRTLLVAAFHSIQLHSLALPRPIHPFRVRDRVSGSGGSSGSIRSCVAVVDS